MRLTGKAVVVGLMIVGLLVVVGQALWKGEQVKPYSLPDSESPLRAGSQQCPAFFDTQDITTYQPAPPEPISSYGEAVLQTCGPIHGTVTTQEFVSLTRSHPELLNSLDVTEDKLQQIWMRQSGFEHIYCGQWEQGIGGLHYWGRYWQLQQEGSACGDFETPDKELGAGEIYTIGVVSADQVDHHPKKGYALGQSAHEILRIGTRAFVQCCDGPQGWGYSKRHQKYHKKFIVPSRNAGQVISNVVQCKADDSLDASSYGLLTVYPDATPSATLPRCDIGL